MCSCLSSSSFIVREKKLGHTFAIIQLPEATSQASFERLGECLIASLEKNQLCENNTKLSASTIIPQVLLRSSCKHHHHEETTQIKPKPALFVVEALCRSNTTWADGSVASVSALSVGLSTTIRLSVTHDEHELFVRFAGLQLFVERWQICRHLLQSESNKGAQRKFRFRIISDSFQSMMMTSVGATINTTHISRNRRAKHHRTTTMTTCWRVRATTRCQHWRATFSSSI